MPDSLRILSQVINDSGVTTEDIEETIRETVARQLKRNRKKKNRDRKIIEY
ncbi:MAG: hypothetical protein ACOCRO_09735 [Halanaerobiales bacterium]